MAKITFINNEGAATITGNNGSIMELAVDNSITGIDGDCGGVCSCATCHVHVRVDQMELVGQPSEIEKDMLELDDNANQQSRLCCQIDISDNIDGLVLTIPG